MEASFGLEQSKQMKGNQQEGESTTWGPVRSRLLLEGQPFCGMIQTHPVPEDSEELSQVILHQPSKQKLEADLTFSYCHSKLMCSASELKLRRLKIGFRYVQVCVKCHVTISQIQTFYITEK